MMKISRIALSIAGSDPSGGAGVQADLKTFHALGVYGAAVIAALTAQNTVGVTAVKAVQPAFIEAQLEALLDDIHVDAAKTGMLLTAGAVRCVAGAVRRHKLKNLVVDPVMVSSSGKRLLTKDAVDALVGELLPLATLVTPNIDEAELLSGIRITSPEDAEDAGRRILALGPRNVLIKGGHLKGDAVDFLFTGKKVVRFTSMRVHGKSLHGAGCVYSAAITACLAKGMKLADAVAEAKAFVSNAIKTALPVGKGRLPVGQ